MKIILILLGAGTVMSLLTFVFGMWYLDAAEHSRVILKHRPVVGTVLALLGVGVISFVFVADRMIVPFHVFYMVGFGMTSIFAFELILCGAFFWQSAIGQRGIAIRFLN